MANELISIVLCTYNGENFLAQQLDSLLHQTYPNLEIIIADDASTDGTKAILEQYVYLPNVHIHHNAQNMGFAKNFEQAIGLATGQYICFADQDDVWLPHKIERLYQHIGNHDLIYSNSLLIDEHNNSLNKHLSDFRKLQNIYDAKGFVFLNAVSGHTMMVKRSMIPPSLPIPEGYYHDWWFAIVASNMNGVVYLDEVLTHYRQHSKTVTKTIVTKKSGSRKYSKRFEDHLETLAWIKIIANHPLEKNKAFLNRFYELMKRKEKNSYVWSLFFFMVKHQATIFRFSTKGFWSQLFEIRKFARGEKETD
jgi:glycosyltransferase involved in cell wall biosynthesis